MGKSWATCIFGFSTAAWRLDNFFQDSRRVRGFQTDIHGRVKSRKRLTTASRRSIFFVQNLDGLLRAAVWLAGAIPSIFEPETHGVQRILYLVRHARGDATQAARRSLTCN